MKIELSTDQIDNAVVLLNRLADLYSSEAAVLARMEYPVAHDLAAERLDAVGNAQELVAALMQY